MRGERGGSGKNGKSTLLWSMAGLHGLSGGQVLLDGEPVTKPHPQIAMVFQEANLLPWRTLIKNVQLPFEIKGINPAGALRYSTFIGYMNMD